MEITTTMNLEVTFVEKDCADIKLPCGAVNDKDLEEKLKNLLNCDDLHLNKVKTFALEERVYE